MTNDQWPNPNGRSDPIGHWCIGHWDFRREAPSRPRERPVADPVGPLCRSAEAAPPVGLVLAPVPLEPVHLTVALECQDVRRDPVEEPAIV